MSRLPVSAFVALVVATVGAFFVVQHLKVTTPLIAGLPAPVPSTIDPVGGGTCLARDGKGGLVPVSFRRMKVSFYLLNRADNVNVSILDQNLKVVDTLPGSGRHMGIKKRRLFVWDGHEDNGSIAPDGIYDIQVSLVHQGRTLLISDQSSGTVETVTVRTRPPDLRVTRVTPSTITAGQSVTIRYAGNDGVRPEILIYRLGPGGAHLVKQYAATSATGSSLWDGRIAGRAAPSGTYLIGLTLKDRTCERIRFPNRVTAAAAPHAVVTVN